MIGVLTAITLATDLACNSGTLLGVVAPGNGSAWSVRRSFEGYLLTSQGTVDIPLTSPLAVDAIEGRVLAYHFVHAGTTRILELRIATTARDERTGSLRVEARGVEMDLNRKVYPLTQIVDGRIVRTFADRDQTLSGALAARILPAGPAHIVAGTITPTATVPVVEYAGTKPLDAVLAWVATIERQTGVRHDIWVERNGTTNYRLHVGDYSASAPVVDVFSGTNLLGYRERRSGDPLLNRAWFDDDDALHRPTYIVSAVNAAWIEVQDLAGGLGPAQEDDEWNTAYWVEQKNGTVHQITDTVVIDAQTTRLYMASTTGIVATEYGYLAANTSRDDLAVVESASRIAAWGLSGDGLEARQDHRTNLWRNPQFARVSSGVPVGWSVVTGAGTLASETTTVYVGTHALRIASATGAATITEAVLTLYVDRPMTMLLSAWVRRTTGAFAGELGVASRVSPASFANVAGSPVTCDTDHIDTWVRHDFSVPLTTVNVHEVRVRLTNLATTAGFTVYLGAIMLTEPGDLLPYRAGSGAAQNIADAHRAFTLHGEPQVSCDVDLLDLAQLFPAWNDKPLDLGSTLRVTAPRVGLPATQLRVVDWFASSDRPSNPRVTVSTRRDRLTALLAAR